MEFQRAIIVQCQPKPNYRLWIQFSDGLSGEVDVSYLVGKGVFTAWESVDFFNKVYIDPKAQTVAWGGDLDLDPYVLREKIKEMTFSKRKPTLPSDRNI
jgi:hypothetical protein